MPWAAFIVALVTLVCLSCGAVPRDLIQAKLTGPIVTDHYSFRFNCSASLTLSTDRVNYVSFTWTLASKIVHTATVYHSPFISTVDHTIWRYHMGSDLICTSSATTHSGKVFTASSDPYRGEIQVIPGQVDITEGEEVTIRAFSTLPIICECPGKAVMGDCLIALEYQSFPENAPLSSIGPCEMNLGYSDWSPTKKRAEVTARVTTVRDLADKNTNTYRLDFLVRAADHCEDSIFAGARLNPVFITAKDEPIKTCMHHGDPHVESFDGRRYSFYPPGTYLMHQSNVSGEVLQVQSKLYPSRGLTTCGTAVRLGNYVVMVTMCSSQGYNVPLFIANQPKPPPNLLVEKKDDVYQITASCGQVVRIKQHSHSLDVAVLVPESLVDQRGTSTCNANLPSGNAHRPEATQLALKMRLTGRDDVFLRLNENTRSYHVKPISSRANPQAEPPRYCQCTKNGTLNCSPFINNRDPIRALVGWDDAIPDHVTMTAEMENITHELFADWRDTNRAWPTGSGITNELAMQRCKESITDYAASHCAQIMGSRLEGYLESCAEDILIADDFRYLISTVSAFEAACVMEALKNSSNYEPLPLGTQVVQPHFSRFLCPENCNLQGTCHDGICRCRPPFFGRSCAVNGGQTPRITSLLEGTHCDIRKSRCLPLVLRVENVDKHSLLYACEVARLVGDVNGHYTANSMVPYNTYPLKFINKLAVSCEIPILEGDSDSSSVIGFRIRLVQLGVKPRYGNPVDFLIYDGICRYCDQNFNCYLKMNTCLIEDRCYRAGESRPGTINSYRCNPDRNPVDWTV